MIRAPLGDQKWWDKWTDYRIHNLQKEWKRISEPSKNPISPTIYFRYIF